MLMYSSNTAQVLTSFAEVVSEGRRSSEASRNDALKMLQEALELFQRCLTVQEIQFTESQERMEMADEKPQTAESDESDESEGFHNSSQATEDEQWASVIEPVTKDTLVDTAVAQLETLTTACSLLIFDAGSGLAWAEEYSNNLLLDKIATYVEGTDRHHEVDLARANFMCALADTNYRTERIDLTTYLKEIGSGFGTNFDLSQDPQGLCDRADASTAFISATFEKQLTIASTSLTSASKLPTAQNLAKINIARGDVELLRFRLGEAPFYYVVATKHAATLLKNAETYFRGAAGLAKNEGSVDEEREATIKSAIASTMAGDESKLLGLMGREKKDILGVVEDMVEDGIVSKGWSEKFEGG